ncbi:monovalent cation/H+ antiporter complex subunit F [Nocardiopsis sp. RSe5-2]|uniref:Monovalent cation/H+ antiporter complex subunit F n=1 Tax=Nocardiopsis endophytica TaxID=3018445 RepID=A0ABT4U4V9_9ACTN|nr:monovalent cation/H+ antiporter complex subunit F [Nocardiopsis endophytica]MDA2811980.1 monovalent cation/H+ antiporter complex subunit F [Nocardiopsis endophytica]
MNALDVSFAVTGAMLAVAVLLAVYRLVRGPSVLDRVIGLSTVSVLLVCFIALEVAVRGDTSYVGVMVSIALLGFIATLTAARFAERRAHDRG